MRSLFSNYHMLDSIRNLNLNLVFGDLILIYTILLVKNSNINY